MDPLPLTPARAAALDAAPPATAGPHRAAIAMGSNLGDRAATLAGAVGLIGGLASTKVLSQSRLIETDAVGPGLQNRYLNGAITVLTGLPARELLDGLLDIERRCGRVRRPDERWGPRTLDLDLLLYDDQIIHEPGLDVPHPRLHERSFVLVPLAEIAGDWIIPGREGQSVADALRALL